MATLRILGFSKDPDVTILAQYCEKFGDIVGSSVALQYPGSYGVTLTFRCSKALNIVAVHGYGSHGFRAWMYMDEEHGIFNMWLRDFLPSKLPRARVMIFGYDSGTFTRSTADVNDIGQDLCINLSVIRHTSEINCKHRPLVFVAHSFGGIVVKQMLVLARNQGQFPDIPHSTRGIIFLGTPHRGASAANYGDFLARIASVGHSTSRANLKTLKEKSKDLFLLTQNFAPLIKDNKITIVSFYEAMKTSIGFGRSTKIVSDFSAVMQVPEERQIPLRAAHREMTKFKHSSTPEFNLLIFELLEIVLSCSPTHQGTTISPESMSIKENTVTNQQLQQPPETEKGRIIASYLPSDSYFYGRKALLESIEESLSEPASSADVPRCCVLQGLGGVGKTQLVMNYMNQHQHEFEYIFFMVAESKHKLAQSFTETARQLELADKTLLKEPEECRRLVRDWFSKTKTTWLVILDNADDPENLVDYWPCGRRGTIMLTSRNTNLYLRLPVPAKYILVGTFSLAEASDFLISRTSEEKTPETMAAAEKIAIEVGCLALSLRQISAFVYETRSTLQRISTLFGKREGQVALHELRSDSSILSYKYTLATVWDSEFKQLEPSTADLLNILCLLDPDRIQESIFRGPESKIELPIIKFLRNELRYLRCMLPLVKYAMVNRQDGPVDGTLTIHRVVQRVNLARLCEDERTEAFNNALELLTISFPKQELGMHMYALWPLCEEFSDHVISLEAKFRFWKPKIKHPLRFIDMICDFSWYCWEIGRFESIAEYLDTAEDLCTQTLGMDSLQGARILVMRGSLLAHQNKYNLAGPLFRQALCIRERHLPEDSQLLANSLMQMGNFQTSEGQLEEAIENHRKAIEIRSRSYHLAPGQMCISHLNLARCLLLTKQHRECDEILLGAEKCLKDLVDKEGAAFACGINFIRGNLKLELKDFNAALDHYIRACEGRIKTLGDHYQTAAAWHKVAIAHEKLGDYSSSIFSARSAISTLERAIKGATGASRLARTEILLSKLLTLSGALGEAMKVKQSAFKHYAEGTGKQISEEGDINFDLLVPYVDR